MENRIFINHREDPVYPSGEYGFSPSERYPEYAFDTLSTEKNCVYEMIRESFHEMQMDVEHYGTSAWNPLGEIIHPGDTVLIKPNLVSHKNPGGGVECLTTHPSVIRAVLDYVLIALKSSGRIILGDAPVQSCDFDKLLLEGQYLTVAQFYKNHGIDLSFVDFRETTAKIEDGVLRQEHEAAKKDYGVVVDIGKESAFRGTENRALKISNYDTTLLKRHHNADHHEYSVYRGAIEADVIINLPKPKTHRLAGMTGSLKNMIGLNTMKEYLPHHSVGGPGIGDEYPKNGAIKVIQSYCQNRVDSYSGIRQITKKRLWGKILFLVNAVNRLMCSITGDKNVVAGCWYGNDTIWRTIIDVNRILVFADKKGELRDRPQRKIFTIADMLICGQGDGPLHPTPYKMGIIMMGANSGVLDKAIAELMGIDPSRIPTIMNAGFGNRFALENSECEVLSNDERILSKNFENIQETMFGKIKLSAGWEL